MKNYATTTHINFAMCEQMFTFESPECNQRYCEKCVKYPQLNMYTYRENKR